MSIPIIGENKNVLPVGHPLEYIESQLHAILVSFRDAFDGKRCVSSELLKQGMTMMQQTDTDCITAYITNLAIVTGAPRNEVIDMARIFGESYMRELMQGVKANYGPEDDT